MFRALFLIPVLLLMTSPVAAKSITGEVNWQGKMEFSESVRVEPGATLTVEPGAQIIFTSGGLEVAGVLLDRDGAEEAQEKRHCVEASRVHVWCHWYQWFE